MTKISTKMRVGILTRRAGFNLGSSLQAYAMAKFISNAGFDCKIINYDEYSGHPLWKIRPFIEDIQWALCKYFPLSVKFRKYNYLYIRDKQYKNFRLFDKRYLPLTHNICNNYDLLRYTCQEFDVLVCGSDQIWSPLLYDPVFLFGFLKNRDVRTVAYAPSFGVSNIELIGDEEKKLIKNIDFLSCREERGAKIIEELTGISCPIVLDPTLMVDLKDWKDLAESVSNLESEPYILCYYLGHNVHQKYVRSLSEQLRCKVLNIQMFNRINSLYCDREITDLGPCEFLNLIKNATWVCTDSFHATIFSYLFKRKLTVFERFKNSDKDNQNSRIQTLLKILDIESVISYDNEINRNFPVNYSKENTSLNEWIEKSIQYLHESLK